MAKYRLERKIFFLGENGEAITGEAVKAKQAMLKGSTLKEALGAVKTENATEAASKAAKRASERAANIANPGRIAAKTGFERGTKSVGVLGGIKNTWNKGGAGKAGLIAAGTGAALLAGKALFGGKKDK